jgi:hypothetical protein
MLLPALGLRSSVAVRMRWIGLADRRNTAQTCLSGIGLDARVGETFIVSGLHGRAGSWALMEFLAAALSWLLPDIIPNDKTVCSTQRRARSPKPLPVGLGGFGDRLCCVVGGRRTSGSESKTAERSNQHVTTANPVEQATHYPGECGCAVCHWPSPIPGGRHGTPTARGTASAPGRGAGAGVTPWSGRLLGPRARRSGGRPAPSPRQC